MDAADRDLFERSLAHATEQHRGAALDTALDELGWSDALIDDRRTAVSMLFEMLGAANATSGALDHVLVDALGLDDTGAAAVVLPMVGQWSPPGVPDDDHWRVNGVGLSSLERADRAVVVTGDGTTDVAIVVPIAALTVTPIGGLDPSLGLMTVRAEGLAVDGAGTPIDTWNDAVALGRIALGHELVGVSRTMLRLACEHTLERIQFDVPIATFQAVRHRLADTLVAIETADAALGAAWDDPSPQTAAMAKALAGRGARTAARHCQQVLAGIGFTTEHELHHYVRRTLVLDELFGSARTLARDLGTEVLASGRLPAPLPL